MTRLYYVLRPRSDIVREFLTLESIVKVYSFALTFECKY